MQCTILSLSSHGSNCYCAESFQSTTVVSVDAMRKMLGVTQPQQHPQQHQKQAAVPHAPIKPEAIKIEPMSREESDKPLIIDENVKNKKIPSGNFPDCYFHWRVSLTRTWHDQMGKSHNVMPNQMGKSNNLLAKRHSIIVIVPRSTCFTSDTKLFTNGTEARTCKILFTISDLVPIYWMYLIVVCFVYLSFKCDCHKYNHDLVYIPVNQITHHMHCHATRIQFPSEREF